MVIDQSERDIVLYFLSLKYSPSFPNGFRCHDLYNYFVNFPLILSEIVRPGSIFTAGGSDFNRK